MTIFWFATLLVIFFVVARLQTQKKLHTLRMAGLYPAPGKATEEDVKRLINANEYVFAIRCYREVHPKAGLTEAKAAVARMR